MFVFRSSSTIFLASLTAIGSVAWLIGLIVFAGRLPTAVENKMVKTEAIVVLTGGSERVATGIELLANGAADRLYISGVGAAVSASDLIGLGCPDRETLVSKMTLGSEAVDTPGNALEMAKWAVQDNIGSIRLVTAAYHMPRSLRELSQAIPNIEIIPHPVFPEHVKSDWWRHPGTASLIAGEYTKYLFSGLRLWQSSRLTDHTEDNG